MIMLVSYLFVLDSDDSIQLLALDEQSMPCVIGKIVVEATDSTLWKAHLRMHVNVNVGIYEDVVGCC